MRKWLKTRRIKATPNPDKLNSKPNKCPNCKLNAKDINSFECSGCKESFHKNCDKKDTSEEEFAMIKTGGSEFVCEDCIAERNGMGHLKLLMNDSNTEKVDDEPHKNQDKEVENDQNIASEPNKQSDDEPTEQITTTGSTSTDVQKQHDQLNPNIASKESIKRRKNAWKK